MAKNRKTRKEKIIAALRRQLRHTKPEVEVSVETTVTRPVLQSLQPTTISVSSPNYSYVLSDIRKTAIVTTLILIGQLTAYFIFLK